MSYNGNTVFQRSMGKGSLGRGLWTRVEGSPFMVKVKNFSVK